MSDVAAIPLRMDPADPRFGAVLAQRGSGAWADPAFPYDLAGAGTARGEGAAREVAAGEALDLEGEPSGDGRVPGPEPPEVRPATGAVFMIEGDGSGALGVVVRPGYLRGEVAPVALLRDFAAPADGPACRSLVREALAFAREAGAVAAAWPARGAEPPVADLPGGWEGAPPFERALELRTVRVVPALWRFEDFEYKVMGATKVEIPALAYLLDQHRRDLAFAPPVDEASFVAGVARCPNLKIGDFRLARYKGELAAMCAVWEPGPALPLTLERPSPLEALMSLKGKVLGRLSPFPRLPGAGGALRVRFVRNFAARQGHPLALRYLLDRAANEARKAGAHAIELALPAGSELFDCVAGRVRRVRTSAVWLAALSPDVDLGNLGPMDPGILDPGF